MENGFTIPPKKPPASLVTLENIVGPSASITEEQYTWNERKINEIRSQQQLCKNCHGISCEQTIEGMVPVFTSFRGFFSFALHRCPHSQLIRRKKGLSIRRNRKSFFVFADLLFARKPCCFRASLRFRA